MCIEFIDGTKQEFTFEDQDYYGNFREHGYHISLNKIKNSKNESIFQEEVFIPYNSIKKVRKEYEYQIERENILERVKNRGAKGITETEIKKELSGDGVRLSENDLKDFLEVLKIGNQIVKKLSSWVAIEFTLEDPEDFRPYVEDHNNRRADENLSCGRST